VPSDSLKGSPYRGLQLGALISVSWLVTLMIGLRLDLHQLHPLVITAWILVRSFLHTGLFILAHDAMHNSLVPGHGVINQRIGRVCLWLYAGLNYDACKRNHQRHHLMPESEADPDFCPPHNRSLLAWLVRFLRNYLNPAQLSRLILVLTVLLLAAQPHQSQPLVTVSVIFLLPLLISTAQLFFVGTYLPHRKEHKQTDHEVSIKSLNLHPFVSLLACYHFGYHREHHSHPKAPWFQLPELRTGRLAH
jgi:beta-carotene ketolase (CrtW type)